MGMFGVSDLQMRLHGLFGGGAYSLYLHIYDCGHWNASNETYLTYCGEVAYMGAHTCGICNATGQVWKCGNKEISEHYHCDCGSDHILESSKIW